MSTPSAKLLQKLYVKDQKSAAQISQQLLCSQHKVNYWLTRYRIPKRSIADALYQRHNPNGDPFLVRRANTLQLATLFGFGLGLYWGEGNKRNPSSIRLGNTDPLLIRKFIRFLTDILGVSIKKLRFGLQIFSDMNPEDAKRLWLEKLKDFGVTNDQFQRSIVTKARAVGTYRHKTSWGVLTVYCSNIKLKHILDEMLAKQAE